MEVIGVFMEFIQQWGPYLGLPIIVAFLTQGLKVNIPFFSTVMGLRVLHFLPLVLGLVGGFLLPEETWQNKLLIGGALGSLSQLLYKIVAVSLARKAKLEEKLERKTLNLDEVKTNKFLAESLESLEEKAAKDTVIEDSLNIRN